LVNNHTFKKAIFAGIIMLVCVIFYFRDDINRENSGFNYNHIKEIDTLEFAPHHPKVNVSALAQIQNYPSPQFKEQHQLLPNFLWMDPSYLGGLLQPKYNIKECVKLSTKIQAELAANWHYYYIVNTNLKSYKTYRDTNTFSGAWVNYANNHTEIPIAAISFWAQLQPNKVVNNCAAKMAYVYNNQLPDCCYVHNNKGELISRKYASPLTTVNALECDFLTQSVYVDSLLASLKRPIQMINENGEVFRVYEDDFLAQDKRIVAEKNKYQELNWNEFQAMKRLEKEIAYKNSFMLKPALKQCLYTEYAIDGQNEYRHDYKTMRNINSKINNQCYATPDFYPRYPDNWKTWKGPWHGLKWLQISRKTELALGDNLFSPFVAAGWDSVEVNNIRPAQWLGLLKILGAMGAEYYYSGFFNTGKEVAKPENYIWQAAMPIYAQAITSHYEDILRHGKMLEDENYIQYPKSDVPVVVRKSIKYKTWVIACSWQTGSNFNKADDVEKTVKVDLGHKVIKVKARRQGSVYVYSEENNQPVFYQIDGWHQYMHPSYWSKNIMLEAELYADKITTTENKKDDFTNFISAVSVDSIVTIPFSFHGKTANMKSICIWLKNDVEVNTVEIKLGQNNLGKIEILKQAKFSKYIIPIAELNYSLINGKYILSIIAKKPGLQVDKIEIVNE
jgi:hypothetical protein